MKTFLLLPAIALIVAMSFSTANADIVVAQYDFTANSLANTAATTAGVSVSAFSVGNLGDLTDNGASDNLRLSGDDNLDGSTGTALTNGNFLSFDVTVAPGFTVDLNTLSIDTQVTNAFQFSNARIFTSIDGFDAVVGDTLDQIGLSGGGQNGSQALTTNVIDFNGGSYDGANISDADFDGLTDTTVTFFIPWIDNSSVDTRFTDIDNVILNATVTAAVPEPSSIALLGLGGMALLARRRK